jgi:hypothetical protein
MARLLKCYGECGGQYLAEELVKVGAANHCKPCADKKIKEQTDRDTLYKTIQKIYNIPYPNGQMLKQMKDFKEQRNYTYEGMTKTLCYAVKVLKMTLTVRGALAILPYHYDAAQIYYVELEEKRKNTGEIKTEVVNVKMTPLKHSTEKIRQRVFVNMEGLT